MGRFFGAVRPTQTHLADFHGYPIEIIDHNNQSWLTGEQVGKALGMKNARANIRQIHKRHADEFNESMTCEIDIISQGQRRNTRIFSPRGAWMLGMWSQTEKAKLFRRWVLDVLEKEASQPPQLTLTDDILEKKYREAKKTIKHLQAVAVKVNPEWQKIKKYKEMGLNNTEISKLMGLYPSTITRKCREMEAAHLIDPPANLAILHRRGRHMTRKRLEAKA